MNTRFGLSCALVTPVADDGRVDLPRLVAHARERLTLGCSSVTAFGTTGEGASIDAASRDAMLAALRDGGLDMERNVVACICATAAADAIVQLQRAVHYGVRTLLLPPPYYFKGVGDAGLHAWFTPVLAAARAAGQRVILYHIPSVTAVPLSADLIARLRDAFPETVRGVKDSSGDWNYGQALLQRFPDLAILIGDERRLAQAVRMGAGGAISGLANVVPELLLPLANRGQDDARISSLVDVVLRYPVTPAVKELVARTTGEAAWRRTLPPLSPLAAAQAAELATEFDGLFEKHAA